MSKKPQIWVLAGGNGAGNTTFYNNYLAPLGMPLLNADNLAKVLYPHDPEHNSYIASRLIGTVREAMLHEGYNFSFETVFSHHSKIDFIARAKGLGYEIIVTYIHLESPSLNLARVQQRVSEGGHHVPEHKVTPRLQRLVPNSRSAIPQCDQVRFYDNSRYDHPYELVQVIRDGVVDYRLPQPRAWLTLFD